MAAVAEAMTRHFCDAEPGGRPAVRGLVLAGPGPIKTDVSRARLDPRLAGLVVAVLDTAHGGAAGLREAVAASAALVRNAALQAEMDAVSRVMTQLARGTGLAAVGARDVLALLGGGDGCVEELVVSAPGTLRVAAAGRGPRLAAGPDEPGALPLHEWAAAEAAGLGVRLTLVSNATAQGRQLEAGLGGVAAVLRYPFDLSLLGLEGDDEEEPGAAEEEESDSDFE